MATLKFKAYYEGAADTVYVNDYISDGHGDEEVTRTNRYITGEHACGNRCVGFNCPSDPALASDYMNQLRTLYEHNRGNRGTKGATDDSQGATHYQLIGSWEPEESVPTEERYEMMLELINGNERLRRHAHLLAAHENKRHDHIHDSLSAYSITGDSKLAMNNDFLYELRREFDRICVAHGYSIVYSPELMGDKEYAAWFDYVLDQELVTIHPPRPKKVKEKSEEEKYAAAKAEEHLAKKALREELLKPHRITAENIGTDFYSLPHVYHPQNPNSQLYIYALDEKGDRKSPLQLDMHLQYVWANGCLDELKKMPDFPGKLDLAERLKTAYDNALDAYELMGELDIGTRAELKAHIQAVGGDMSTCRQEIARQEKVIATAKNEGDTLKLERAEARKAKAEEKLDLRNDEYRNLKRAEAVMSDIYDGEHWEEFRRKLLQKSTRKVKPANYLDQMVRRNYSEIGQLFGIPQEEIDAIIGKAASLSPAAVTETWTEIRGELRITYTKRADGMAALYESIRNDYAERRQLRKAWYDFERNFPVVGPITLILYLALAVPLAVAEARKEAALERRIAYTRQLAEDIRWHNKHAQSQFSGAKTLLAIKLLNANEEQARAAWAEFDASCADIMERAEKLKDYETAYGATRSSVKSIEQQYRETKALQADIPDGKRRSLADIIKGADAKAVEQEAGQKSTPYKGKEWER